jgi:3-oxoacyl-[acyl-carrier protein] reductase
MTDEEFDSVWQVHVKGTFWCAQAAARRFVAQGRGGVIINTTSGAHFGSFGQTNYAAAKGAIASMTYTWALELARYGIRVNAIGPLGSTQMSATYRAADGSRAPQFDPTANGPAVVFLCSDEADYVSGQVFGTGGERFSHMVQPHYGKTLMRPGGWDVESLRRQFRAEMQGEFGVFGILGEPYPFHDGVHPPARDGSKP